VSRPIPPARQRFAGAALGVALDRLLGEPPASLPHPVALLGRGLGELEARTYRDDRAAGVVHAATGVAIGALAGGAVRSTAAATAACVAGRMLGEVAAGIGSQLAAGDIDAARHELRSLAGRDADELDEAGIARAVVESVAENTVDAVVAPALWAAALGPAGAGAHKAASTLDSMVGHHSERYERFGWASARLDDVLAWVPARVTALLVAAARPDRARAVVVAVRRDAPGHPSPNAGVAEAAFAAALGVQLGGRLAYAGRVEDRARLGDGPAPSADDIARAVRLSGDVAWLLAGSLAGAGALAGLGPRRRGSAKLSGDA
jgi:adenosylcobinamide-phosphate synthase